MKWICRCDCGAVKKVCASSIRGRRVASCGCLLKEKARERMVARSLTHGMSSSPEHSIWAAMKSRCHNPKSGGYRNYGGRGIAVCERWINSFENFYSDVGPRPSSNHSIERIDNSRNYEPGNVRWATAKEQARNRRSSAILTFNGISATIAEWSEKTGLTQLQISHRLRLANWSIDRILTTPIRKQRNNHGNQS